MGKDVQKFNLFILSSDGTRRLYFEKGGKTQFTLREIRKIEMKYRLNTFQKEAISPTKPNKDK